MTKPVYEKKSPGAGMLYGFAAVLSFSLTLPATRLAVASLDPIFVGLGRSMVAACLAAPLLYFTRQPRPNRSDFRSLGFVVLGVVIGFPILITWAMRRVPASHGAVVIGLLPAATAIAGTLRAHERPSKSFWCASAFGSLAVIAFALASSGGSLHAADLALLGAVAFGALGYAEGGRLARKLGGWQVICWALIFAFPLLAIPVGLTIHSHGIAATRSAWLGFGYVSVFSAFLGFFAWYHGLALGGIARVSQLQLFQPFLTLIFATLFLGERFSLMAAVTMGCVAVSIFFGRRSKVAVIAPGVVMPPVES